MLEFAGVYCDDNEMPEDTLRPGQFAEGCNSHDLPNAAGRLVFDELPTPFFIKVPAAS